MTALKLKPNESKYPTGYLQDLRDAYEENHTALINLAKTPPSATEADFDAVCLMEHGLLHHQAQLLDIAASVKISGREEVRDILELWHRVAIEEVSPYDVTSADKLILAVYDYISAQDAD